ncbi:gamma-glutamyltransferase [Sphingomonas sp.]|uniref:gamma-glutamyltransferase n=1 Tax=Sphingomonas sp. TaxID=28214 RepID=UPI0025E80931|nr:gamma-glutamyltransferase [Sphingomonas sp.]
MKPLFLAFVALLATPAFAAPNQRMPGVVTSADPRATAAGQEMLRAGGSAADAEMAMMLALSVVEPQSSGIGGGGLILYHDTRTGTLETIDGRESAPAAARADRFLGGDGKPLPFIQAWPGGLSVGVPGNIRLAARVHQRWGRLPWARLFEPAIRLAPGYEVSPLMARRLRDVQPIMKDYPAARALFWQGDAPKTAGAIVRNPALAAILKRIATEGPDAFYTGENAQAIVDATQRTAHNPADMTLADLAAYRARDRAPVCAPYRQYRVCGMGPPSSGATTILQMLGMLERFDMKALGPHSPVGWHLIGEAMQLAYADREKWLGDGDFVQVPVAGLIDRTYLKSRSALISATTALPAYGAGTPHGARPRTAAISSEIGGTTHFVAVDARGNVATMTSTVESLFGSQLIANGMMLNNELTDFTFAPLQNGAPVANAVAPGKRPLSSMSPTIVYDARGRVVFAVGSAGGKRIIMHVMKALVGKLDWGLSAADAIALPNIYFGGSALLLEKGTFMDDLRPKIAQLGQTVVSADLPSKLNAVERTPTGWRGAADPRSEGNVLGE